LIAAEEGAGVISEVNGTSHEGEGGSAAESDEKVCTLWWQCRLSLAHRQAGIANATIMRPFTE